MPPGDWSYEIVLGDPMAIVLMDAWVVSLYYLDIWVNVTDFGVATMQMQVWFAYWGLCLVSHVLKRWRKEHCFSEVDSTLLAVAVTVCSPILVFMLEHIENCAGCTKASSTASCPRRF
ncbi:hypothetical protein SDRG_07154 [Saprolegnia diclina VS20]|uniref:Uncharacterized protein n=1 Tax=Saprolegnia diclina (strain VS20) TaxID=1156394 RepID=T0QC40_SAPDV|nr:hypothetical protein SDRG_07154 [Saprolegnia diclina VS20]EQC35444.1 hypothetical protein SDRG_07154 [Saprolegnia diclina VS20]|eukprot:XP_008611194.1 hypothetical protein SDRG_07154 [Saprolegnia diclina VS20]